MASVSSAGLAAGMDIYPPGKTASRTALALSAGVGNELDNPPARLSAQGKRQSAAASFLDAAQQLMDPATWMSTQALSSQPDVVSVVSSPSTPEGRYSVEVNCLASAQTTASAIFSGLGTTIGLGTLNLDIGTWDGSQSAFLTNPNWPKASLTIGPKDNSLERVRDRINASGVGVVASVISDSTGSRLVLRASNTGASHGFKIEATPSDTEQGLEALGFNPPAGDRGMMLIQAAGDGDAMVDQRQLTSSTNTLFDDATGLSLQLHKLHNEPVAISVHQDSDAITRAITNFAKRYNEVVQQGDSGTDDASHAIQTRMQQAFSPADTQLSMRRHLQDIGLTMGSDQQLRIDPDRLLEAVQTRLDTVCALLGPDMQQTGLAQRFQDISVASGPSSPSFNTGQASDNARPSEAVRRRLLASYQGFDAAPDNAAGSSDGALTINT